MRLTTGQGFMQSHKGQAALAACPFLRALFWFSNTLQQGAKAAREAMPPGGRAVQARLSNGTKSRCGEPV
ncbi:hypothetical protein AA15973_0723 [Komagataeibacter sucrofermentans DSM 15973]|nr:hypothetical protein AA15973_0723 [Komagataeibacter sucrofermentans DSM 15973]